MAVSPQLVKRVETRDYALTVLPRERSKRGGSCANSQ
jgi:hypothetical protein